MEETLPRTSPHAVRAQQVAARWQYLSATVTSASGSTVVQSLSQNDVLSGRDKSVVALPKLLSGQRSRPKALLTYHRDDTHSHAPTHDDTETVKIQPLSLLQT